MKKAEAISLVNQVVYFWDDINEKYREGVLVEVLADVSCGKIKCLDNQALIDVDFNLMLDYNPHDNSDVEDEIESEFMDIAEDLNNLVIEGEEYEEARLDKEEPYNLEL